MKLNKKIIFSIVILLTSLLGQSINKDSLVKVINNPSIQDSSKFYSFYDLSWEYIYSDVDSAYMYAKKAYTLLKKCKLTAQQPKVTNLLGACFQVKGDYVQAIGYYQQSLNYGEKTKNNETILTAYSNIGALYIQLKQYKKALEYQLKALPIAEKGKVMKSLPSIYNNLCLIYNNFGDNKKALEFGLKSLELYQAQNNKNGICSSTGNLGNTYLNLKEYDKALENFLICYKVAGEIENYYERARAALDIGEINAIKNKNDEAIKYYLISKDIASEADDYETSVDAVKNLYLMYKKKGDKVKALENYEVYVFLKEKLNNSLKQEEVSKRELEFEFNKRAVRDSIKNAEDAKVKDLQLKANKAQIENDKLLKVALSLGLILVIGFGLIIFNRFRIISRQKQIIEAKERQTQEQKDVIENKNKEILDSINYAQRIQLGLLANKGLLNEYLKEENYFILFKPKDIVSGDFYWTTQVNDLFYLAICDSTGHGVPGAFMSLLNMSFLSEAIKEKGIFQPNKVFDYVRQRLVDTISSEGQQDGFDGVLLCFNKTTNSITYAAANNSPVVVSKPNSESKESTVTHLSYDKMPVGKGEKTDSFTLHTIDLNSNQFLYLYTDGYPDQFGGPKGKKFKYNQLDELLLNVHSKQPNQQLSIINQQFIDWKGNLEQVDDVCVIGIKL